ncbi:MAG: preprotein translocase subunit SecG [Planctomycetes bacterium]|nr:preprotein translocase subunit SecG [Planctomycetota bacterium]
MIILKTVLIVVEILCGLLLIGVILLQKSKGQGLGLAFGAEMGESLFGAQAGNVLVKVTIWVGVIFLLNTTILAKIYTRDQARSLMEKVSSPAPIERTSRPVQPGAVAPAPYSEPAFPVQPASPPSEGPVQEVEPQGQPGS